MRRPKEVTRAIRMLNDAPDIELRYLESCLEFVRKHLVSYTLKLEQETVSARGFRVGSMVMWTHKPKYGLKPFVAKGIVTKIYQTTVGGGQGHFVWVAQMEVCPHRYWTYLGRKKTTISIDKLSVIGSVNETKT